MTVKELKAKLNEVPDDYQIAFVELKYGTFDYESKIKYVTDKLLIIRLKECRD